MKNKIEDWYRNTNRHEKVEYLKETTGSWFDEHFIQELVTWMGEDDFNEFFEAGVDGGFAAADDDDGACTEVFGLVDDVYELFVGHLVLFGFAAFAVAVLTAQVAQKACFQTQGKQTVAVPGLPGFFVAVEVPFEDGRVVILDSGHYEKIGVNLDIVFL